MKTTLTLVIAAIVATPSISELRGQNVFPTEGNAGIGTTTPAAHFEIKATQANAILLHPYGTNAGKTSELRFRELSANGVNYVGLKAPDKVNGNIILTLPESPGVNGQMLSTDGNGKLLWKTVQSGANTSLSNLASTKINQSLLPETDGDYDLGSSSVAWDHLYISGNIYAGQARMVSVVGNHNTFLGISAGADNIGSDNTFIGEKAGNNTTSGNFNDAYGSFALFSNTTGSNNVAVGANAMYSGTTGFSNASLGYASLYSATSGNNNTAVGNQSMFSTTTGYANVAAGASALYYNLTGINNVAIGYQALFFNLAESNTAAGSKALLNNTTGEKNSALGTQALQGNATGIDNVALGYQALYSSNGSHNTATGYQSLYSNSGNQNTATGCLALYSNTSGDYNTAEGYSAGSFNDNSSYCSFFGYDADQSGSADLSNATAIGWTARITADDQVRIGNSVVTSIGGFTNWSNISDGRFKKDVSEQVPGLAFINLLRPVTYHLDVQGLRTFLNENAEDQIAANALARKEAVSYSGFIAQEVEAAAAAVGYDFSGVDGPKSGNDLYGLRYAEFVVPLTKAVQELSGENALMRAELNEVKEELMNLREQLESLSQFGNRRNLPDDESPAKNTNTPDPGFLGQNIPNPFGSTTIIPLRIPADCFAAYLVVSESASGKIISVLPVEPGDNFITLESAQWEPGIYSYSLVVNEKVIATRQMITVR
jgi:hypothetical protein